MMNINIENLIRFLLPSPEVEAEMGKGAMKLAEAGWALSPLLTPKFLQDVADSSATSEYLNSQMIEFYSDKDGHQLHELLEKSILNNPEVSEWHATIQQAKQAYDQELFNVVVPSLITVIEGVLAKLVGTYSTQNVRMIAPTKSKAEESHTYQIDKSTWLTISKIVDILYQKSDFSGNVPDNLNRHWVLHGRHTPTEAKNESLKLFNLLGALCLTVA